MHTKPIIMIRGSEMMRQERLKMEEDINRKSSPSTNLKVEVSCTEADGFKQMNIGMYHQLAA